ncbi:CCAAT/enhancer-binding protein [Anopheles aquasalis]|uniref:CCAAT/enhancer-binding protein n=1 Tax=Anopheles aquasalis TaxID=42839 RepID=UPI00215A8A1B|nr:CCAAT/enhancer-binding protein [Anopheles aquasalis]
MESPQMYDTNQIQVRPSDIKKLTMAANNSANGANGTANGASPTNNNSPTAINQNTLALKQQQQQHQQQQHQQVQQVQQQQQQVQQQVQQQQQQQQQVQQSPVQQVTGQLGPHQTNGGSGVGGNGLLSSGNLLSKQMLQQIQYSQSELDELTSQEISLDLQHLIDDQFRDPEALGIFTEMVTVGSTNGTMANPLVQTAAAKALQLQQARLSQHTNGSNSYQRSLAYMPQPVHTGAAYGSTSSDENSSVGSSADSANIKEEPIDPNEYRRQLLANGVGAGGGGGAVAQFIGTVNGYQLPGAGTGSGGGGAATPNGLTNGAAGLGTAGGGGGATTPSYVTNGNGNSFSNLTPATVLHHQALPHLSGAAHLANLTKHSKLMPHVGRKTQQKVVDKGTDEYRRRRERNNIAVRKSREKAKVRSREVEEKVKALLKEKDVLIRKIEEKNNEITLYKQLYMHLMNHSNPEINQICRSALNLSNMGDHM